MCDLSNVTININNRYYLVTLTLFGAIASCEVLNSNLAAVLFSSPFAMPVVFLQLFPNCKLCTVVSSGHNRALLCYVPSLFVVWFFVLLLNCVGFGSKFSITFCVCLSLLHNPSNVAMAIRLVSNNN